VFEPGTLVIPRSLSECTAGSGERELYEAPISLLLSPWQIGIVDRIRNRPTACRMVNAKPFGNSAHVYRLEAVFGVPRSTAFITSVSDRSKERPLRCFNPPIGGRRCDQGETVACQPHPPSRRSSAASGTLASLASLPAWLVLKPNSEYSRVHLPCPPQEFQSPFSSLTSVCVRSCLQGSMNGSP
jgi:hypothetical protein